MQRRKATVKLLMHVRSRLAGMIFSELGQMVTLGRRRCQRRLEAVRKRRREGGEGNAAHHARGHGRSRRYGAWRWTAEICRDDSKGGGARCRQRRWRGSVWVRVPQGIRNDAEATRRPRVHLDIAREREEVKVEGSVFRHERAEEGRDTGRHVKALGLHTKACTEGMEFLDAATTARISQGIGRAKDVAHMKVRLRREKGRQGMQELKGTLGRVILSPLIREVEGGRQGVRLENDSGKVTEEGVEGGNGSNERHELERGDAIGMTRARLEGKGEEEAMTVATEAEELPLLVSFRRIHGNEEGGHGAQLVHKGREGCGDRQERNAIVV